MFDHRHAIGRRNRLHCPGLTIGEFLWHMVLESGITGNHRVRVQHARTQAACFRNPQPPCRPASGSRHRGQGGPDLPDHFLRVPGFGSCRGAVQPRTRGTHLYKDFKPDHRGTRRAPGRVGRRCRRDLHRERDGRAASGNRDAAQRRRPHRRLFLALWRQHQPAHAYAAALRHHDHFRQAARAGRFSRGNSAEQPAGDRRNHRQPRPGSA